MWFSPERGLPNHTQSPSVVVMGTSAALKGLNIDTIIRNRVTLIQECTPGTTPVGAYIRLSLDKAQSSQAASWRVTGEQVKEQLKDILKKADSLSESVTITHVYNDNDTTATDPNVVREGFEASLRDLESGGIRGLLFYVSDRLARMDYDAARVNRIFLMNPDYIGQSVVGSIDLSTDEGRAMFMMQATVGGMEVSGLKRRTKRTNEGRALNEEYQHKGRVAFGWGKGAERLDPLKSQLVLEAIRAIPGGRAVAEVRRQWRIAGFPMGHANVEQILVNPRNCGYKVYISAADRRLLGRPWSPDYVVYDDDGKPVIGPWDTICTPAEWAACVETLVARKTKRKASLDKPHDTTTKYWLAGIAICGKCAQSMRSNSYSKDTPSYEKYGYRYACLPGEGGCGGITRAGPPVEEIVRDAYLGHLDNVIGPAVDITEEIDETIHDARIATIKQDTEEIDAAWKAQKITTSRMLDLNESLSKERAELVKKRRALLAKKTSKQESIPNLREEWDKATPSEKKSRVREAIRAVVIHPQGRGKPFDPALIEIVWAA